MSDTHDNAQTSLSLLERARRQDSVAWQRLVQLYSPLVFHWARQKGLSDEPAADIVQDVWLSVSTSLTGFQKDATSGSFRAWLWTITLNKLRDRFRKSSGEPSAVGGTDARTLLESVPDSEPPDVPVSLETELLHRALEAVRGDFEPRTWQAFWKITVDQQPAADVGEQLGMAANAVHQARFRVLRRLRQELEGLLDEPLR